MRFWIPPYTSILYCLTQVCLSVCVHPLLFSSPEVRVEAVPRDWFEGCRCRCRDACRSLAHCAYHCLMSPRREPVGRDHFVSSCARSCMSANPYAVDSDMGPRKMGPGLSIILNSTRRKHLGSLSASSRWRWIRVRYKWYPVVCSRAAQHSTIPSNGTG